MKKVLFFAATVAVCCAFTSCKKSCTCKEKVSGTSQTQELSGSYSTCSDLQSALNATGKAAGLKWTCTSN